MSTYIMIISGILLLSVYLLIKAENSKGSRIFLGSIRNKVDIKFAESSYKHYLNKYNKSSSLRIAAHFIAHHTLGALLIVTKYSEEVLNKLRRQNRIIAKSVNSERQNNHLHHIAKHKQLSTLTPEEKTALKERSLND